MEHIIEQDLSPKIANFAERQLKIAYCRSQSYYYPTDTPTKILSQIILQHPNAMYLAKLGKLLDEQGRCEQAIAFFEHALLQIREDEFALFEIYRHLGNAYLKIGDQDSAQENYHKALSLQPQSSQIHINLGALAVQKNEWFQVQFHFREALRIHPKQDKAWAGLALYHQYMGDFELALANLKKALDLNPTNRVALLLFINWAQNHQYLTEGLDRLMAYLGSKPEDPDISLLLVQMASQLHLYDLAELELTKLICLDPDHSHYQALYSQLKKIKEENK